MSYLNNKVNSLRTISLTLGVALALLLVTMVNKVHAYTGDFQAVWTINAPYVGNTPPADEFYVFGDSTGRQYFIFNNQAADGDKLSSFNAISNTGDAVFECEDQCDPNAPENYTYFTYNKVLWNSSGAYVTGQLIQHNSNLYTALVDDPTTEPGTNSSEWQLDATDTTAIQFHQSEEYNLYVLMGDETIRFTWNPIDFFQ